MPIGAAKMWFKQQVLGPPRYLYGWGYNTYGQIGYGGTANKSSPVKIGSATNWTDIATGTASLGISGGALYAWGNGNYGELGNGTNAVVSSPVRVGSGTNWTVVGCGDIHSLGIAGGALYTWGSNTYGQLGDGTTTVRSSPVRIGSGTNWTVVAGGGDANGVSFGIAGGALYAWGYNSYGVLGNGIGTNTITSSPVRIGSDTNWTAIMTNGQNSLGVAGGAIYSWGRNNIGQLGDGTIIPKSSPVRLGSGTNWTFVAGGTIGSSGSFSLGIAGGALYAWGSNLAGQLGMGNTSNYSSPVRIGSVATWTAVTCLLESSHGVCGGILGGCGNNVTYGQLGDGTTVSKSAMVQIGAATSWKTLPKSGGNHQTAFCIG